MHLFWRTTTGSTRMQISYKYLPTLSRQAAVIFARILEDKTNTRKVHTQAACDHLEKKHILLWTKAATGSNLVQ